MTDLQVKIQALMGVMYSQEKFDKLVQAFEEDGWVKLEGKPWSEVKKELQHKFSDDCPCPGHDSSVLSHPNDYHAPQRGVDK